MTECELCHNLFDKLKGGRLCRKCYDASPTWIKRLVIPIKPKLFGDFADDIKFDSIKGIKYN